MPDLTDTAANADGAFVFQTNETTPQQVVRALDDFTTFLDRFESKSREYGEGSFFFLGSKGQFSDIYRKIIKLKTALWDGKPEQLTSEGVEEVIHDLIGHLFMTLQCLRHEGLMSPAHPKELGAEPQSPRLQDILVNSSAYGRLVTDSYPDSDPREWLYDKGDRVKMDTIQGGAWLSGQIGEIVRRNVEDAGTWYTVKFVYANGQEVTVDQSRLSIVSRSQEWWDKHHEEQKQKDAPRKVKDQPQA